MKGNESSHNLQRSIRFFRDLQAVNPPKDAPMKLVGQCIAQDNARELAMRVSMQASGLKLLACATKLGIHESYLSRLIRGAHSESGELPEWFVEAFCWATGSNLLKQCLRMEEADEDAGVRLLVTRMASDLRSAA